MGVEFVLSSLRTAAEEPLFSREHMQLFKRPECGRVIHMFRVKCVLRLSPQ